MYVCTYIHICVCICISIYICLYIYIYISRYLYIYTHTYKVCGDEASPLVRLGGSVFRHKLADTKGATILSLLEKKIIEHLYIYIYVYICMNMYICT